MHHPNRRRQIRVLVVALVTGAMATVLAGCGNSEAVKSSKSALVPGPVKADEVSVYDAQITTGSQLLEKGMKNGAFAAAKEAIAIDANRFEGYALATMAQSGQKGSGEREDFIGMAVKLAPEPGKASPRRTKKSDELLDFVRVYEIWDKTFNTSAKMSSAASKYAAIVNGIDYAAKVECERPGDINILLALQSVYGLKLGSSILPEFPFYSEQFRKDSMPRASRDLMYPQDKARERTAPGEPLVNDQGVIRAELLSCSHSHPADLPAGAERNDGSELQYLKEFQPFPYGIGPMAMSYNYARRAQVAASAEGQIAIYSTPMVIDSHPALTLKFWEEDDARRGELCEARAFGIDDSRVLAAKLTGIKPVTQHVNADAMHEAIYYYDNALRLSRAALREYHRHLAESKYAWRVETYRPHLDQMHAAIESNIADRDYLQAILLANAADNADPYGRLIIERLEAVLLECARAHYDQAMLDYECIVLRYYMEDAALWPQRGGELPAMPGAKLKDPPRKDAVFRLTDPAGDDAENRARLVKGTPGVPGVFEKAMTNSRALKPEERDNDEERTDYQARVRRCQARIEFIRPVAAH